MRAPSSLPKNEWGNYKCLPYESEYLRLSTNTIHKSYLPAKWYLESTKSAAPPRFEKSTLRFDAFETAAYFSLRSLENVK